MIIEIILIILLSMFILVLLSFGWGIGIFNTCKVGQQDIKTQLGNMKTEYQRRADLFYNLVQAVKSHKKFEKETLVEVIQARNANYGKTPKATMKTMSQLDGVFSKLMVLFEKYPELKSNEQHNKLMQEVRITEDRINVARTDYNEIVGDYNKLIVTFPRNIIAHLFRFTEEIFFENEESTTNAPKINLD